MATPKDFIQTIAPYVQGALDNPVSRFLLNTSTNTMQDIGTGLGINATTPGMDQSRQQAYDVAGKALAAAKTSTDPQEKQRLFKVAQDTYNSIGQGAASVYGQGKKGDIGSGFSPDVQDNYIKRGLLTGLETGTTMDMAAHPVQTVKDTANLLLHPIQSVKNVVGGVKAFADNPEAAIQALKDSQKGSFTLQSNPNGITNAGIGALIRQYKSPNMIVKNLTEVIANLERYGLTKPEQISNAARVVTGSTENGGGIVNGMVKSAVKDAGPIDMGGFYEQITKPILDQFDALSPGVKKTIGTNVKNAITKPGLNGQDPEQLLNTLRTWEGKAYPKGVDGKITVLDPASDRGQAAEVYKELASQLQDKLFYRVNPLTQVKTPIPLDPNKLLTLQQAKELESIHPQLLKDVQSLTTVPDARSIQSDFVQGSKMVNKTERATTGAFNLPQVGGMIASSATGNPMPALAALSTTQQGENAIGNGLLKLGRAVGTTEPGLQAGSLAIQGGLNSFPSLTGKVNPAQQQNDQQYSNDSHNPIVPQNMMFPEQQTDSSGHYTLPTTSNGSNPFMSEADFQKATAGLTPGTPDYIKISQKFSQDQAMASAQSTPAVNTFMKMADPIQRSANSLFDQLGSNQVPMDVFHQFNSFNDAAKKVDPQYQPFVTKINGLNGGFSSLYESLTGQKTPEDLLVSPKDFQEQAQAKITYMTNFFAGMYGRYKDAYAATNSPSGLLSPTGGVIGSSPPPTQNNTDWSSMTQGAIPAASFHPTGLPALTR